MLACTAPTPPPEGTTRPGCSSPQGPGLSSSMSVTVTYWGIVRHLTGALGQAPALGRQVLSGAHFIEEETEAQGAFQNFLTAMGRRQKSWVG